MKHLKTLGVVAVAATALMAFVASSTASATVLCSEAGTSEGTTCPAGKAYGAKTGIHLVNKGNVKIDTTFKTIECSGSTYSSESENEGEATSTPTFVVAGVLTFTACNCTVTVIGVGVLQVHWIAFTWNGIFTAGAGLRISVTCGTIFGNVHCVYVANNTQIGTLTGGNPATLAVSSHLPVDESESDAICPEESTWTATYEVTSPKPLFVTGHT